MRCAKCGADNREGRKFCAKCAAPLALRCPQCGASNEPGEGFCGECAAPLGQPPAPAVKKSNDGPIRVAETSVSETLEGERKTVTALFADIKGSTELMEDLDPEEARAVIDPALKLMIEAVRRYDGYVVQSTGDGIFALFGAPVAHEDHPQRALYAALRLQEELKRHSDRVRADGGLPIQARIGVNTGEVVVRSITTGEGQTEYTPIGHTTNLASRMQTAAPVGSIAVSENTRKLCEGYFVLKPLGATRVKGLTELVNVYEVTGLGPLRTRLQRSAGRGLTKFVGRDREMEALKHAADQAKAGHGQIVAAVAEPGVGKSRLYFEFKATSQSGWMVLETFSVSHGKASAYLPVIDLLRTYFDISAGDDERKRREKVAGRIAILDRTLEDTLPYLFSLLGIVEGGDPLAQMDGQIKKRRTLEAIKRIALRESLNQPLMMIFEDLHWIDEATQELLNLLADSIGTAKILLLVNYRPEYSHQWSSKTYYTQLRLDPLGRESADEMLSALIGSGAEVAPLKQVIVEKTEGNPFFMEETVQVLLDEGALERDGAAVKLTKPLNALKIPPTVQAILAARIDRLAADHKDLLQTLAVIGTEFKLGLVRKVAAKPGAELETMLSELQLGEFIYEQPASGDIEYIFKHALTHDVAYDSVLMERRRALHERTGAALEALYAANLDDHVAELAHHFGRSGNPQKAVEYCAHACRQCTDRGSFVEAVAHFEAGLKLLQELPDDDRRAEIELDLRIAVRLAQWTTMGYASREVEQSSTRAIALCQRPGLNWEKTWSVLYGFYAIQLVRPDTHKAREIAAELIERAEKHGSRRHLANAVTSLAFARMESGEFEPAAEGFERGMTVWESIPKSAREGDRLALTGLIPGEFPARNNILAAWNLCFLGHLDRALQKAKTATALALQSGSKAILEAVHNFAMQVYQLRREPEHLRKRAEVTFALATELGNPFRQELSQIYLGWVQAMEDDLGDGIAQMQKHLSQFTAAGAGIGSDYYLALIATALGRTGQFDEALRTIDNAFPIIERTGARFYEAEIHRLKGELLVAQNTSDAAQAQHCFNRAIEISRMQLAKLWELRATMSLARLLDKQGRRDEARAMLAQIYNWFTEGFDTADLKDAKTLVDELSN